MIAKRLLRTKLKLTYPSLLRVAVPNPAWNNNRGIIFEKVSENLKNEYYILSSTCIMYATAYLTGYAWSLKKSIDHTINPSQNH